MMPLGYIAGRALSAALPAGAIGVWYPDQAVASPRKYIPNAVAAVPFTEVTVNSASRRFQSSLYTPYAPSAPGATYNQAAPDGSNDAIRFQGGSLGWYFSFGFICSQTGTYSFGVTLKSNTSSANVDIVMPWGTQTVTVTTTAQRFFFSGAISSTGTKNATIQSANAVDLLIFSPQFVVGTVDPGPDTLVGNMLLGTSGQGDTNVTLGSGYVDLSNGGSGIGLVSFPVSITLSSGFAFVILARKISGGSAYTAGISGNDYNALATVPEFGGVGATNYSNAQANFGTGATWGSVLNGLGWHTFASRYDLTSLTTWFDGGRIAKNVTSVTAQTIRDLFILYLTGSGSYGGGWQFGGAALFNRPLTDTEVRDAKAALLNRASAFGIAQAPVRIWIAEGDSIAAAGNGHADQYRTGRGTPVIGQVAAIAGSTLASLESRAADIDAIIPPAGKRVAGSKYILSFLIGANDNLAASDYLTRLFAYADARRSAGWIVVIGTILPFYGNSAFNSPRISTINPAISASVGTHCDAVVHFGDGDSLMATDALRDANPTYWTSGDNVHPSQAGQDYMYARYKAVIDAL